MKMRHSTVSRVTAALLFAGCATIALAQVTPNSTKPPSAHTELVIQATPQTFAGKPAFNFGPPFVLAFPYVFQTPASMACIYGLVAYTPPNPNCNPNLFQPNSAAINPTGGSKAIALVDAYDDPNAAGDLAVFSTQFGLPPANFHTVFAPFGGTTPGSCDGFFAPTPPPALSFGWDIEEALDIEWSHAMAPHATIYLVEAQSDSFADLLCAETVASNIVASFGSISPTYVGGGEVSNSWGASEFFGENTLDGAFNTANVVYFASAGDIPGTSYPAVSPKVIAVGGTSLIYNENNDFLLEGVWQLETCGSGPCGTGGGVSIYETRPAFQNGVSNGLLSYFGSEHRGTPDVAADADPYSGAWVYDSDGCGRDNNDALGLSNSIGLLNCWYVIGGTSLSSPVWAGIVNNASTRANSWSTSSQAELMKLYGDPRAIQGTGPSDVDFNDITYGNCYFNNALTGYDLCTGLGSPKAYGGK